MCFRSMTTLCSGSVSSNLVRCGAAQARQIGRLGDRVLEGLVLALAVAARDVLLGSHADLPGTRLALDPRLLPLHSAASLLQTSAFALAMSHAAFAASSVVG